LPAGLFDQRLAGPLGNLLQALLRRVHGHLLDPLLDRPSRELGGELLDGFHQVPRQPEEFLQNAAEVYTAWGRTSGDASQFNTGASRSRSFS